ncbi:MAG: hypothetical protein KAG99_06560, partial [Bacteroidales bacterium]|nr:hypothetical protein [Bacteroidales bacterium]
DTTGKVSIRAIKAADEDKPEGESDEDEDKEFKEYVFLYEDGIARMQEVKTGIQDNTYIFIIEGLEDGQEVIVAPYRAVTKKLKNNDEVEKVDKEKLFTED